MKSSPNSSTEKAYVGVRSQVTFAIDPTLADRGGGAFSPRTRPNGDGLPVINAACHGLQSRPKSENVSTTITDRTAFGHDDSPNYGSKETVFPKNTRNHEDLEIKPTPRNREHDRVGRDSGQRFQRA